MGSEKRGVLQDMLISNLTAIDDRITMIYRRLECILLLLYNKNISVRLGGYIVTLHIIVALPFSPRPIIYQTASH